MDETTSRRDDEDPAAAGVDRRTVVAAGAVALVGIGLTSAGCASSGDSSGAAPGTAAEAAPGTALGKTADVPVGGGAVFTAAKVVVTQPTAGTYVGLSAVCTHQGCLVKDVSDGMINCPCHGSRYHLDGSVARGPATTPLGRHAVTAAGGELTLG